MCSKALQTTQEQHQKMFAEMQKALQTANQQRTAKPQPTELSAATVQALASLIRDAPPASSAPPPPSSGFDVLPPLGVDALGGSVPMAGPGAMALGPVPGHFGAVASADGMPMGGGVPGLGGTSLRESFDAINLSLQRLVAESSTKVEATKSLNTVSMILGNILKDPTSDKHPKVNTTSARFSELFRNNGAASDLLKLAGFQYQEPNFTFGNGTSPPSVDACQRTLDLLQEFQRNIDQAWAARQSEPGPQAVAPADAPADEVRSAARPWATGGSAPSRPPNAAPLAPWATLPGSSQYSTQGFTALPSAVAALPSVLMQDGPSADDGMAQLGASAPSGEFQSSAPIFSGGAPVPTVQAAAGVAHPAESQPPAMAHPAEASPTPAPPAPVQPGLLPPQVPVMAAPPAAAAPAAALPIQQLPIAHPAEVAPVVAAHPAEAVSASEEPQSGG
ncbi:unnamed protein product [Polarella glacialis]|uniref:PUB domain-containing protein n=1 Tax=Polarella glacialis TaxID=89957 RepID=A0A813LJT2_POLGL|nr:unnamed protein product [Polarella glacialis]